MSSALPRTSSASDVGPASHHEAEGNGSLENLDAMLRDVAAKTEALSRRERESAQALGEAGRRLEEARRDEDDARRRLNQAKKARNDLQAVNADGKDRVEKMSGRFAELSKELFEAKKRLGSIGVLRAEDKDHQADVMRRLSSARASLGAFDFTGGRMAALRGRLDAARAGLGRDEEEAGGDADKVSRLLLQVRGDIERAQQVAGRIAEEEEALRAKRDAGLERRRKLNQEVRIARNRSKAQKLRLRCIIAELEKSIQV